MSECILKVTEGISQNKVFLYHHARYTVGVQSWCPVITGTFFQRLRENRGSSGDPWWGRGGVQEGSLGKISTGQRGRAVSFTKSMLGDVPEGQDSSGFLLETRHVLWNDKTHVSFRASLVEAFPHSLGLDLSHLLGPPYPAEGQSLLLSEASDFVFLCSLRTEPPLLFHEILCCIRVLGPCVLVEDSF